MPNKPERNKPGNSVVARKADGNPEGKGHSGLLQDWTHSEPKGVVAKPHRQVLAELFTSMLVLSANFKYRPAVNATNYLYWVDRQWHLSLVAPEEWSDSMRAGFVGECVLQRDMTWSISPSELLGYENPVSDAVSRFFDAFAETLDSDLTLDEILPFHVGSLAYYQRLYANALSRSVRSALALGRQTTQTCRQWSLLLPPERTRLLAHSQ